MDFVPPPDTPWTLGDLSLGVLDHQPEPGFDCGRTNQNEFLYQRAWRDTKRGLSVTHLLFVKGVLAAFATLMMDRVVLGPTERPKGVSYRYVGAVKIAQLAVDRRFAGHGLGRDMVAYVVQYARTIRLRIGCRLVTLDAEPELIEWYEGIGFQRNLEEQEHRRKFAAELGRDVDAIPVSMRFDLRDLRERE